MRHRAYSAGGKLVPRILRENQFMFSSKIRIPTSTNRESGAPLAQTHTADNGRIRVKFNELDVGMRPPYWPAADGPAPIIYYLQLIETVSMSYRNRRFVFQWN
ncbi:hypothetical protein EVAR_16856_1 [Eumeta japonica]|uniref:Uncharacterized protein n=1 Tax=Eumeta variegata TaxID=151549 RepID=A0A4C1V1N3_EUMVA|nr:hypothetical protein EVAR_16856_1 [Eumeta japonica]